MKFATTINSNPRANSSQCWMEPHGVGAVPHRLILDFNAEPVMSSEKASTSNYSDKRSTGRAHRFVGHILVDPSADEGISRQNTYITHQEL